MVLRALQVLGPHIDALDHDTVVLGDDAEDTGLRAHAWSRLVLVRLQLARAREIVWQLDLDDVR